MFFKHTNVFIYLFNFKTQDVKEREDVSETIQWLLLCSPVLSNKTSEANNPRCALIAGAHHSLDASGEPVLPEPQLQHDQGARTGGVHGPEGFGAALSLQQPNKSHRRQRLLRHRQVSVVL